MALALALAAACSSPPSPAQGDGDESEDGQGGSGPEVSSGEGEGESFGRGAPPDEPLAPPAAPAPPAPPELRDWDCPPGWPAVTAGEGESWEHTQCRPPELEDCPAGQVRFLGEPRCHRLGEACPAGDELFPTEAEIRQRAPGFDGPIVYFSNRVREGGAGSREDPFGTFFALLNHEVPEEDGTILALSVGEHRDVLAVLGSRKAVVGACATGTVVARYEPAGEPPDNSVGGAILMQSPQGGLVTHLTVTGDQGGVLALDSGEPVVLRQLFIEDVWAVGAGSNTTAGPMELEEVVIRRVRRQSNGDMGLGVWAPGSGGFTLRKVILADIPFVGVYGHPLGGQGPPDITVEDAVFRDIGDQGPSMDGGRGTAVLALDGARITLRRSLFVDTESALKSQGTVPGLPSEIHLEDVAIRSPSSVGISLSGNAVVDGRRVDIEGAGGDAIEAWSSADWRPPSVALQHVQVAGCGGAAVHIKHGDLTLDSALLDGNLFGGLAVGGHPPELGGDEDSASVRVTDTVVRGPADVDAVVRGAGWGLLAWKGGSMTAERVLMRDVLNVGAMADGVRLGKPSSLVLHDVAIRGVIPEAASLRGGGVRAQSGATAVGERVAIERSTFEGLASFGHTSDDARTRMRFTDLTITDVQESPASALGVGIAIGGHSEATVASVRVTGTRMNGVVAASNVGSDARPQLSLSGVTIDGIARGSCGDVPSGRPASCVFGGRDYSGGIGLFVRGAGLEVSDFLIRGAATVGLHIAGDAEFEARSGVITGNSLGLLASDPEVLSGDFGQDVFVYDNDTDVSRTGPEPPDLASLLTKGPLGGGGD